MTIEEMLRAGKVQTAENGLVYAVIPESASSRQEGGSERGLEKMVSTVPHTLVPRLGRTATYFVPWLTKVRRSVSVALDPAPEGENRKELCHHLDVKPAGNLLLISLRFYEHDSYGLAMEFFDKIAYLAALEPDRRPEVQKDLDSRLQRESELPRHGELTPEAWEWRQGVAEATAENRDEAWGNYRRAAEADTLGLYMASMFTDIFYEDLFEPEPGFPPLPAAQVYDRVRLAERLYPANRGYSFQIIRQRQRRRRG